MNRATVSKLLNHLLEELCIYKESILVLRNYRGYPDHVTGDVDFLVRNSNYELWKLIEKIIHEEGWTIGQMVERPWIRAYTLVHDNADRPFFVLDFFLLISWYTLSYISVEEIFIRSNCYKNFKVPSFEDEGLITITHYALYSKHIPEKYRERWKQVFNNEYDYCYNVLCAAFGQKITYGFLYVINENLWNEIPKISKKLRLFLTIYRFNPSDVWSFIRSLSKALLTKYHVNGTLY